MDIRYEYESINSISELENNLEEIVKIRNEFADYLSETAKIIKDSELESERISGKLELQSQIDELNTVVKTLREGVFRLLILGDMKRGKSTFLNALIGENLVPIDVNPCTAILTILRYGQEKKVTIYFTDDNRSEVIDFGTFKKNYTISPDEAKRFQEEDQQAFPDVAYAVVEYPLSLLKKGVEIIDSPGLNDTEARNQLVLDFIQECHAILFVLSATQQFTLAEKRYLENYISGRGLTVFFLINRWDEIKSGLIDPDDHQELEQAESKVRKVFESNLYPICQLNGKSLYEHRVFAISALNALRARLANPPRSLEHTGFSNFAAALTSFLTHERAMVEMNISRVLSRLVAIRVKEAVETRIPLLNNSVEELQDKIRLVKPEFDKLRKIRDQFLDEIVRERDHSAEEIANSFKSYFSQIDTTFEKDFTRYQPELKFLEFVKSKKRKEFEASLKTAFEKYLNDKIADWGKIAESKLKDSFLILSQSAEHYAVSYSDVTRKITEGLTGRKTPVSLNNMDGEEYSLWKRIAAGAFTVVTSGDLAGGAMAASGAFSWKKVLGNWGGTAMIVGMGNLIAILAFNVMLTPLGAIVATLFTGSGIGTFQANRAKKKFIEKSKNELQNSLSKVVSEGSFIIQENVNKTFTNYRNAVTKGIDTDVETRQSELDNLLAQKEQYEIDRESETSRLKVLEKAVSMNREKVETAYDRMIGK